MQLPAVKLRLWLNDFNLFFSQNAGCVGKAISDYTLLKPVLLLYICYFKFDS